MTTSSAHSIHSTFFLLLFCFQLFSIISEALVPASQTFTYVNNDIDLEFGDYIVEYGANYRFLSPFSNPFQLCFYNTTPNAFTLALRMGTVQSESLMRWVWEANRGDPVRENATFTFGRDGNLVLADADGRVVWQTNTADKGVVGFKVLPTGNMVLHDRKGNYLWQSFDSPTDTLLVDQTLRANGPNKLVSRLSEASNVDGPYSLVMEPKGLTLYYKSPNSPRPMVYWTSSEWFTVDKGSLVNLTLMSTTQTAEGYLYYLTFDYFTTKSSSNNIMASSRHNTTLSYLRLGIDGNLRFFTYNYPHGLQERTWNLVSTFFGRDSREGECQLPGRCSNFGLCEDNQCVACPTPDGLSDWSKDCDVKKVTSCYENDFRYYTLEGVDHFMIKYTRGDAGTRINNCEEKCTRDCKCMGYFYHKEDSRCWIAYDLKTLTRNGNSNHTAHIKMSTR